MAKFYVGQRVRILYSFSWPELIGTEGTVFGFGCIDDSAPAYRGEECVGVQPDAWASEFAISPKTGREVCFGAPPRHLAPISGANEVVTWESCAHLWSPHGVSA